MFKRKVINLISNNNYTQISEPNNSPLFSVISFNAYYIY